MTRRSHPILAICLTVLLTVTGHSMAIARGATAATGQMTLCTGDGPVLIYTDADGQPTTAPHFCPDCALTVLGLSPPITEVTERPAAHQIRAVSPNDPLDSAPLANAYLSRAPPRFA
ncbi:MAG: hypothetical protein WBC93_05345 [Sulfitobacter sp.]